jgi:hypothetical protein
MKQSSRLSIIEMHFKSITTALSNGTFGSVIKIVFPADDAVSFVPINEILNVRYKYLLIHLPTY